MLLYSNHKFCFTHVLLRWENNLMIYPDDLDILLHKKMTYRTKVQSTFSLEILNGWYIYSTNWELLHYWWGIPFFNIIIKYNWFDLCYMNYSFLLICFYNICKISLN